MISKKITSSSNPVFKNYLSLTTSKGLKKEGLFILSGEKLIREFIKKPTLDLVAEVVCGEMQAVSKAKNIYDFSKTLFEELDVLGTDFNLLILKQPAFTAMAPSAAGLEVICPLGDPGNVGALIRSSEAFAVARVIFTEESANPFLPKAVKASAGSVLRMHFAKGPSLKKLTGEIFALDSSGEDISKFKWPKDIRILVGEEGQGVPALPGLKKLSIQTRGVESLNAFIATTIALYEYARKV